MIKTFDNRIAIVGEDLKKFISPNSHLSIAAAIFSIYGFASLKKELAKIKQLRFIFTDPTFIETNQSKKASKFFTINSLNRQKSISGSEFEISLKNELKGRKIAKECRKWCENKVSFKTNKGNNALDSMLVVDNGEDKLTYLNLNEFTSAGLGYKKDNKVLSALTKITDANTTQSFLTEFDNVWNDKNLLQDITDEVISYIDNLYQENSPEFIYYLILYNIFNEFLEDLNEDTLANEKTGFKNSAIWHKLYDFQKDAVLGLINKLEKFNGCILADSVGLGKTFSALGVIKYYQERNKSVLVLCPKKLGDNWKTFLNNYHDNPLLADRLNYDVLYHTDILRDNGFSNGIDLAKVNWANYDLIVIDESHNFRNNNARKDKTTRYEKLLNIIKTGVSTKLLMLSATPVNNRFTDLKNQIALACEGQTNVIDSKLNLAASIDIVLKRAQKTFNDWSKFPLKKRTAQNLLKKLNRNYDFFKLLDSVTIARSRRYIKKYYNMDAIGKFPSRLKPQSIRPDLTDLKDIMSIADIYKNLSRFKMAIYNPFAYIFDSREKFYSDKYDTDLGNNSTLKQANREESLKKLMAINLLKRLESSIDSFRLTLNNFIANIKKTMDQINKFHKNGSGKINEPADINNGDNDDDWLNEEFSIGRKVQINLVDMDIKGWELHLQKDLKVAQNILKDMNKISATRDTKLTRLKKEIKNKLANPINAGNKKIIIFTAFADTANYLYEELKDFNKDLGLHTAKITGAGTNQTTLNIDKKFNNLLSHFSPLSKNLNLAESAEQIDILIATDCIAEGQNLQDCDTLINYDIHWNPVKIIQRFGRIDRIGSRNEFIQLINFWPNISLDEYINLKNRVETKMQLVDTTAAGGENILTDEATDLDFRRQQLAKLENEVVDLEDMDNAISITDLGLNDFRMDLLNYIKEKGDLANVSNGRHTVCEQDPSKNIARGVIFVLKNINQDLNIDKTNQLHPFYLVQINQNGEVIANHLNVKDILDKIRYLLKGKDTPIKSVYQPFNEETKDGSDMSEYSALLNKAISSIIATKDESDLQSLFSSGGTSILENRIKGINDFELIAFLVIR